MINKRHNYSNRFFFLRANLTLISAARASLWLGCATKIPIIQLRNFEFRTHSSTSAANVLERKASPEFREKLRNGPALSDFISGNASSSVSRKASFIDTSVQTSPSMSSLLMTNPHPGAGKKV